MHFNEPTMRMGQRQANIDLLLLDRDLHFLTELEAPENPDTSSSFEQFVRFAIPVSLQNYFAYETINRCYISLTFPNRREEERNIRTSLQLRGALR